MAGEDDHLSAYDPDVSRALLAEAVRVVRAFDFAGAHVTVIGGLVPSLLVPHLDPGVPAHVGTRDVDLCLSMAIVDHQVGSYEKIETALRQAGYGMVVDEEGVAQTWRWRGGVDVSVTIEFLCPAGPGRPVGRLHNPRGQVGHSLSALAISRGDVIDADVVECRPVINLPGGGGRLAAILRVTGPAGFIAAKVDAIARRDKAKDAYDLVWLLEAWPGGPAAAADRVAASPAMTMASMAEALDQLADQFADLDAVGSRSYARFVAVQAATPTLDPPARRAVGAVSEFLRALGR